MTKPFERLHKINTRLVVYATVVVAFFLRVYRLADKNIWWDEGWGFWLARQDFVAIALRTAADEHPPLHYWMLRVWDSLAGWDAFSARFLSVAFGVLTVGLIYRIGKRVGGDWTGVLAALFLATARFHIWWSQDIKNYTPSIFLAFAAVWFGLQVIAREQSDRSNHGFNPDRDCFVAHLPWRAVPGNNAPRNDRLAITSSRTTLHSASSGQALAMAGYASCAALAMLTHYLAALVLLALNLYALYIFAREFSVLRSAFYRWIFANGLAAILFAPWLALYLQNAQAWPAAPAFDLGLFLKLIATALPLGVTTNIDDYAGLTIAFTTLAMLGAVTVISKQLSVNSKNRLFTVHCSLFTLIVVLPPILIYILSLTPVSFFAPKIQARYLLILYPAYAILLALGIALLRKFSMYLALAATLFVLAASALALRDYYAERRLTDDYATLANEINSFARQGDLVLLDTDQEWPTFLYYLRAQIDWLGVPNGAAMTDANADAIVKRALARHSAVWLVAIPDALATDPQKMLQTRLARDLPARLEQTFGDKRVALYARDERDLSQVIPANLQIEHPLPYIPFGDPAAPGGYQAQLIGYDLPIREAKAGDTIYVTTHWFAAATRGEMQLADSSGRVVSSAPFDLTTGKDVRVVSALNVPAIAAGQYTIRTRVSEQAVELARIDVELRAAITSAGSIAHPVDYRLGGSIHLVGYDLSTTNYRAGENVPVTLYWRADQPLATSYVVFVHLLGTELNAAQSNFLWGQVDRVPRDGSYPTTAWPPNQTVADPYRVPIAPNAPAGKYKIEVGLYDTATGERLKLSDGSDSMILAEIDITR
jgi:4-amino-4-deoxy-L-arabinose transferase-like glycosyltransferase